MPKAIGRTPSDNTPDKIAAYNSPTGVMNRKSPSAQAPDKKFKSNPASGKGPKPEDSSQHKRVDTGHFKEYEQLQASRPDQKMNAQFDWKHNFLKNAEATNEKHKKRKEDLDRLPKYTGNESLKEIAEANKPDNKTLANPETSQFEADKMDPEQKLSAFQPSSSASDTLALTLEGEGKSQTSSRGTQGSRSSSAQT